MNTYNTVRLNRLAINEEGFIFDPETGESFTSNQTAIFILNSLKNHTTVQTMAQQLTDEYEVQLEQAEHDISDFISHLKTYGLI